MSHAPQCRDSVIRPSRLRKSALVGAVAAAALLGASCGNDTESEGSDTGGDETTEVAESSTTAAAEESTTTAPASEEFTSPDGDYSVMFPAEPTPQPTPLQLPDGQSIEVPLQVAADGTSEYTTAAITYPDSVELGDPDDALDGAVDGAIANVQGAVLGESEDVEVDGKPGRRFDFEVSQGGAEGRGEAVFVADGNVLYQAIAVGDADDSDAHGTFLDSFQIL